MKRHRGSESPEWSIPNESIPIKRSRSSSNKLLKRRDNQSLSVDPAAVQMSQTQSYTKVMPTREENTSLGPILMGDQTRRNAYTNLNFLGLNKNSRREPQSVGQVVMSPCDSLTSTNILITSAHHIAKL